MNDTGSKTLFLRDPVTLSIGSLTWLTIYFSARLRDLVLATEFQNAMLASAAQLSTRFCLITKRDGSIVYVDPGFQKLFPHFMQSNDRNIDGLLGGAGITAGHHPEDYSSCCSKTRTTGYAAFAADGSGCEMPDHDVHRHAAPPQGLFPAARAGLRRETQRGYRRGAQPRNAAPLAQALNRHCPKAFSSPTAAAPSPMPTARSRNGWGSRRASCWRVPQGRAISSISMAAWTPEG